MKLPTLAVLAGGAGTRMGGPKDRVRLGGRPLLRELMERLRWDGPTILVASGGRAEMEGAEAFDVVAPDAVAGEGPVRGVLTALEATPSEAVIVVPIDMPGLVADALHWLWKETRSRPEARGVMLWRHARVGTTIEPFPSAFRRSIETDLRAFLERGQRAMRSLTGLAGVAVIDAPDTWGDRLWTNLNTPEDVARFHTGGAPDTRPTDQR
jgi:molybdenum cofactor guanylyltransferase